MIYMEAGSSPGTTRVTFELPASFWAGQVYVVGEFNDWDQQRTPMRQTGPDGAWRVTLELAAGSEYEFRYLIDGETWHTDDTADSFVTNEYGSDNSVVRT
jgi:1,4-alpha-glucan branching enzyme